MRVVLTGSGVNPTLNATLGNANDNGGTVITPKLIGIETINVAFTGSGVNAVDELDLQDSPNTGNTINITRVSDGIGVATIDNIGVASENLSVANSGQPDQFINFAFKNSALSGDDDETTLTVQDVQVAGIAVQSRQPTAGIGFETINLVSKDEANSIGTLFAEDLETLNISGNADLTLGGDDTTTWNTVVEAIRYEAGLANTQGSLSKIDASDFEGNLDITLVGDFNAPTDGTSGVNTALTVIGGKGDDIFRVAADVIGATDLVDGGEGDNTMVLLGNTVVNPNGTAATVKNVQSLEVRTGHDAGFAADIDTINADAFDSLANIYVRNEGQDWVPPVVGPPAIPGFWQSAAEGMTVNLNNLTSAQANGITLAHGTTGNSTIVNNILNIGLKNATGAADTATVAIVDGVNSDPVFNAQIAAAAVEQVTLKDNDTESNTVHLNQGNFTQAGSTITLEGGQTGKYMNLDSTANGSVLLLVDALPLVLPPGMTANMYSNQENLTAGFDYAYDAAANAGYGLVKDGTNSSNTIALNRESAQREQMAKVTNVLDPAFPSLNGFAARDAAVDSVFYGTNGVAADGVTRHVVENLDAADFAGNVIIRVGDLTRGDGVSSMSLKTGAGNDTFIFDALGTVSAGFTSGDTIAAGAGTDTLVIDGNTTTIPGTPRISHQTSEWDNLTGIDVLRFGNNAGVANVGGTVLNAGGAYYARIDNDFISQTDNGSRLLIVNNDGDLDNNTESDLVLDLRGLSQSKWVTFTGANANGGLSAGVLSSNRIVVDDISANQNMILDGGDSDVRDLSNLSAPWTGYVAGNNNAYEVRNTAHVSINDLAQTKNFGLIEFTNDQAVAQTLTLVLNNTVVENLVDSSRTADAAIQERLNIVAFDNGAVTSALEIDARQVNGFHALTVDAATNATGNDVLYLDVNVGGTAHTVMLGATGAAAAGDGADRVNWTGGATGMTVIIDMGSDANGGGLGADNGWATFIAAGGATSTTHDVDNYDIVDLTNLTYGNSTINTIVGVTGGGQTVIVGAGQDTVNLGGNGDTVTLLNGMSSGRVAGPGGDMDAIVGYTSGTDIIDFGARAITLDAGTGMAAYDIGAGAVFNAAGAYGTLAAFVAALAGSTTTVAGSAMIWDDGAANSYLFISDGVAGLTDGDILVELTGINGLAAGITITAGDITAIA